jgi:hypothetical protein
LDRRIRLETFQGLYYSGEGLRWTGSLSYDESTVEENIFQTLTLANHRWTRIFKRALVVFEGNQRENLSIRLTANQNRDRRRSIKPSDG